MLSSSAIEFDRSILRSEVLALGGASLTRSLECLYTHALSALHTKEPGNQQLGKWPVALLTNHSSTNYPMMNRLSMSRRDLVNNLPALIYHTLSSCIGMLYDMYSYKGISHARAPPMCKVLEIPINLERTRCFDLNLLQQI